MRNFVSIAISLLFVSCASTPANRKPAQSELQPQDIQVLFTANAHQPAPMRFWAYGDNPLENARFVCVDNSGKNYTMYTGKQLYQRRNHYFILYPDQNCRLIDDAGLYQEVVDKP